MNNFKNVEGEKKIPNYKKYCCICQTKYNKKNSRWKKSRIITEEMLDLKLIPNNINEYNNILCQTCYLKNFNQLEIINKHGKTNLSFDEEKNVDGIFIRKYSAKLITNPQENNNKVALELKKYSKKSPPKEKKNKLLQKM